MSVRGSMVGRDADLARMSEALAGPSRWSTLFGPAGVGKSRIARELAGHGVWVDVSGSRTPGQLEHAVGRQLEIEAIDDVAQAIAVKGALLIVLDDCESLDANARRSISGWLGTAPGLRILATSREIMGEPEERVIALGPLDLPSSKALFLDRALKARGQPIEAGPALDALLPRLDGLPLAIELAASWCDALSVEDLLRRWATLPALEAALSATYSLLDEAQRHHFEAASLFAADFDLDDLESVAGGAIDPSVLATLVRKSLLHASWADERARYRMLESLKAFGRSKAKARDNHEILEDRHAQRALARGSAETVLELSAAYERIEARSPTLAARLVLAMDPALYDRGPFEHHLGWIDRGLTVLPTTEPSLRAALLHARARCLRVRGRMREAYEELLVGERLEAPSVRPSILRMLGVIDRHRGQLDGAEARLGEARALAEAALDDRIAMCALDDLGVVALDGGRLEEAGRRFELAEQLALKIEDVRYRAITIAHQGLALHLRGSLEGAKSKYEAALEGHRRCNDRRFEGWALGFLAILAFERGDGAAAEAHTEAALELYRSIGDVRTRAFLWMPRLVASWSRRDPEALKRALEAARLGLDPIEDAPQLAALARFAQDVDTPPRSIEERLMLRMLEAARLARPLFVGPNGSWFEAEGLARVSLARRRALQRLLHRLVEAHAEAQDAGLDWVELLAAGWPGEKVQSEAGARRVYVAIATLRKLGLQPWLTRNDDGYRLGGRIERGR